MYGYNKTRNEQQLDLLHMCIEKMANHDFLYLQERIDVISSLIEGFAHSYMSETRAHIPEKISLVVTSSPEENVEFAKTVREMFNYNGSLCFSEVKIQVSEEFGVINLVQITDIHPHHDHKCYYIYLVQHTKLHELVRMIKAATAIKLSEVYWLTTLQDIDKQILAPLVNQSTELFYVV